jgi:hypothetical protein
MIYYCENSLAKIIDNSKEVESATTDNQGKYNNTKLLLLFCVSKSEQILCLLKG